MLEKTIQRKILTYLRSRNDCVAFKVAQGPYSQKGISDIICCCRGKFYAFEVKTVTGRATPLQKQFISRVNIAGGVASIVRSVDDVKAILEEK